MATNPSINHILSSSNWRELVKQFFPGADLQTWERMKRNFDARQSKSPKKTSSRKSNTSRSRRRRMANTIPFSPSSFERQSEKTARSTAELVERVNKPNESESRIAWLTIGGFTTVLEVS